MASDQSLTTPLLSTPTPSHVSLDVSYSHDEQSKHQLNPFAFLGADHEFEVPESSTIDPFRNHTPRVEGLYEWLKIVVCLPIALARLLLFGLCLVVGYVATVFALHGWTDKQNPMPKWRCRVLWVTRYCSRFILFSFGYHWIKQKGKPAPREIAPIVVSNHVSYVEPIFFFYELFPTIVASEAHDSMPFVGTIIRAMQVIYVDRFSQSSRKHAVNEIKRKASSDQFPRVLLFPEGTTTNGRVLISFQLGAFIPGYPIQPVIVRYPHVHFDQSWGNISLAKLMFRMFTQFHNFMEVEYLPLVLPHENRKENAVHFAQRTSRVIASSLNVVQTSHSYGDLMLLTKALEFKQEKPSQYMVEMAWVESVSSCSIYFAMKFESGALALCLEFEVLPSRILRVHLEKPSQYMVEMAWVESIKMSACQFLLGSAHILKQPLFQHACELAFSICDSDEKNYILKQELQDSITLAIPYLNDEEIQRLFSLFDMDEDGRISKDDFLTCLQKHPLLIAIFSPRLLHRGSSIAEDIVVEEVA
ncbi:lysophospholipid acyltransferase LPEAT2-like [Olea europaea var. sylvestris]|uniref:lysophospholipid acyltransferase LPEAT2-like n=1 Tax=Olea europaea var. sylvestris TaxID=158386 RepID=UPI000C1D1352|nr:lysophospholipid acyltransferase LPEAT2-like [Olea europaea var. sylvestris]